MRILVDEDSQARRQLEVLRAAGHDVVSIAELDRNGSLDSEVFAFGAPIHGQFHVLNHWR